MTEQEFWNAIHNKIGNEILKDYIKSALAPHLAEQMCRVMDANERTELLNKMHEEWLNYQKRQSDIIQAYLKQTGMI